MSVGWSTGNEIVPGMIGDSDVMRGKTMSNEKPIDMGVLQWEVDNYRKLWEL